MTRINEENEVINSVAVCFAVWLLDVLDVEATQLRSVRISSRQSALLLSVNVVRA